jgi:hypothetical protein
VVVDALSRLDTEMSHSTLNSDAIPESFENFDDKSISMDYPLSTTVERHNTCATHQPSSGVFHQTSGRS